MLSSALKDDNGDKVPLVKIKDLTPCATSSCIVRPGLKHQ